MRAVWRDEDEALLARLADRDLLDEVWSAWAGRDAEPLPPGAVGVVDALGRAYPNEVAEARKTGRADTLLPLLREPDPARLDPAGLHHLALFQGRLGRAYGSAARTHAVRAGWWSLCLWLALAEEGAYLRGLARAVTGSDDVDGRELALREAIDELGARARRAASDRGDDGAVALAILGRLEGALARAAVSPELADKARARGERRAHEALDDALRALDDRLEEARAQDDASAAPDIVREAAALWDWAGRAESVERWLVERLTPVLWEHRRADRWRELRRLLHVLEAPVDHLATRIEADPSRLAYAAPCAQMLVFRAQAVETFDEQLQLAERAVALCATHRNGRLVLADCLVERALRTLDAAPFWGTGHAMTRAARDLRRAEELFPMLSRLPDAKARLRAMGRDIDE